MNMPKSNECSVGDNRDIDGVVAVQSQYLLTIIENYSDCEEDEMPCRIQTSYSLEEVGGDGEKVVDILTVNEPSANPEIIDSLLRKHNITIEPAIEVF